MSANEWHRATAPLLLGRIVSKLEPHATVQASRCLARQPHTRGGLPAAEERAAALVQARVLALKKAVAEQEATLGRVMSMLDRQHAIDIDEEGVRELHGQRGQLEQRLKWTRATLEQARLTRTKLGMSAQAAGRPADDAGAIAKHRKLRRRSAARWPSEWERWADAERPQASSSDEPPLQRLLAALPATAQLKSFCATAPSTELRTLQLGVTELLRVVQREVRVARESSKRASERASEREQTGARRATRSSARPNLTRVPCARPTEAHPAALVRTWQLGDRTSGRTQRRPSGASEADRAPATWGRSTGGGS
eukprot:4934547-Prymnesium_polylepis.1